MSDNYICFNKDLTAPDLLPLDDFISDIPCIKDPKLQQELANINAKIERLTLDSNTQSLRVEIERGKRRKLQSSLKQVRHQLLHPCPEVETLKQELSERQWCQEAVNYQFDGELTRLRTLMFRSLARMHGTLVYFLPHIMLLPDNGREINMMLDEVTRTVRQFHTYSDVTYV